MTDGKRDGGLTDGKNEKKGVMNEARRMDRGGRRAEPWLEGLGGRSEEEGRE